MNTTLKKHILGVAAISAAVPGIAFAQLGDGSLEDFFSEVLAFINDILIPLVIGLALLVFIYGLFKFFILGGGDEESRSSGRQLMLYSILAFFLMVTIFAIVDLLAGGIFGDDRPSTISVPDVQTGSTGAIDD